ncbi:MAG: glycoside hydrolase family 99-like domain-containing protein, partial [Ferruginibacter sp.]
RVDGKPVFSVYRSTLLPDARSTISIWRAEAAKAGLELYLCRIENDGNDGTKYIEAGFDAAIEFQPFSQTLSDFKREVLTKRLKSDLLQRAILKWHHLTGNKSIETQLTNKWFSRIEYDEFVDFLLRSYKYPKEYTRFPGIAPSWDNTARRGPSSFLFKDSNPAKYKEWLEFHYRNFVPPSPQENFIFINAWNEWAEGNHLEPCTKWGRQYLEATKEITRHG